MVATKMTTIVVIFKILFLVLIAHSFWFVAATSSSNPTKASLKQATHRYQERSRRHSATGEEAADSSSVQQKFIPPPPTTTTTTLSTSASLQETAATIGSSSSSNESPQDETRDQSISSSELPVSSSSTRTAGGIDENEKRRRHENAAAEEEVNYAELCYLSNGGSSLTLTVNEASPVGHVIGTIEVNGDPALEGGNVDLFDDAAAAAAAVVSSLATDSSSLLATTTTTTQPTPSASPRAANHTVGTLTAGEQQQQQQQQQQTTSQQATRNLAQRLQRLLGKRSTTIGFLHDRPPIGSAGDQAARQSQALLVAGLTTTTNSPQHQNHNHHHSTAANHHHYQWSSSNGGGQQKHRTRDGKFVSVPHQPNGSFYSVVGAATPPQLPPAVRLEPGTRNLILVRQLDKESAEGEQSILINIRCSPRHRQAAGSGGAGKEITTIPVRIIVTDSNDHAPEFQGAQPYVVNISETTPIETVVLRDIEALDRDSAGPFSTIHYRVVEDPAQPYSSWLQFVNPLVPNLMVARPLDYETQASFQLTIIAQDEGEPEPLWSSAQVQVNIIDFDDQNPRFLDDKYTLVMDEAQQNLVGQNLQVLPRNLYAEDGDQGINAPILYTFDQLASSSSSTSASATATATSSSTTTVGSDPISVADNNQQQQQSQFNVNHYLHLNPSTGEIRLLRQWPASSAPRLVAAPMTLVVRATQADNKDRYTLTTLTVTTTTTTAHHLPASPSSSIQPTPATLPVSSAATTTTNQQQQQHQQQSANETHVKQQGIEFEPSELSVRVPESAPINEKIARVKARYITSSSSSSSNSSPTSAESVDQQQQQQQHPQHQVVDVVGQTSSNQKVLLSAAASSRQTLLARAANERRPINYQILDDQTDQFGINGLGEIFIKRTLDYEQRQEYKIHVLATYLKYSDICRVHVEVLNVNDNKPKFTQPQYTFHITESRLRSNFIGQVQAHDADLNDTVRYSLSGEHSHLFHIHPTSGQLTLRSSIKQLNITSCQLIVIATDSLNNNSNNGNNYTQSSFTHQARLNLHIAPQLVGRSINFDTPSSSDSSSSSSSSKLFSSRSLTEQQQSSSSGEASWLLPPSAAAAAAAAANGKQTKLIVNGGTPVNNQRSSVATVMASIQHMAKSVNFFDMPMSSALLLSALLAFLICLLFILLVSMSVHIYRRQVSKSLNRRHQHLAAATAHIRHAHLAASSAASQLLTLAQPHQPASQQPAAGAGALTRYLQQSPATSARSTNSTNTTQATGSGNERSPPSSLRQQVLGGADAVTLARPLPKLTAKVSPAPISQRPASAQSLSRLSHQSMTMGPVSLEPLETLSAQLQQRRLMMQPSGGGGGGSSLQVSSPSPGRRSKHSYRSTEDDSVDEDSSVMHCGHYSVNGDRDTRQQQQLQQQYRKKMYTSNYDEKENLGDGQQQLVRADKCGAEAQTTEAQEDGSPGIKSYRKLPANLGSLARPQLHGKFTSATQVQTDSAIASDESSSVAATTKDNLQREGELEDEAMRVPSPPLCRTGNLIRWPMPQRVKKLTWDDELSNLEDDDSRAECYLSPDYAATSSSNNRLQAGDGRYQQQQHDERMLFSNPSSPAPHALDSSSSFIGQNNCFDYTIVENSQFQVQQPSLSSLVSASLSAQHHQYLLSQREQQQHQQQQQHLNQAGKLPPLTKTTSYLYSSNGSFQDSKRIPTTSITAAAANNQQQRLAAAAAAAAAATTTTNQPNNQQDLITTAVL